MEVEVDIIICSVAGDDHHLGAERLQHGAHGDAGAAAAQDKGLFAADVHAAQTHHAQKTVIVGVVAVEGAVGQAHKGIHAAQNAGLVGKPGAVGHHRLFIGDGDVETVEVAVEEEVLQRLRLFFVEGVLVIAQLGVDGGGVGMAQRPAQETTFHP